MPFDWNLITHTLGGLSGVAGKLLPGPVGSALGGLLPGVFQGMGDILGFSDSSSSIPSLVDSSLQPLADVQKAASYTLSGAEGPNANREAFLKSRQLIDVPTAESLRLQNDLRDLGRRSLDNANQQMDLARTQSQMDLGNQRRDLLQLGSQSGASPATLASLARTMGDQSNQRLLGLNQQSTQAMGQGLAQSGSLFGQADQSRIADLQNRLATFQPFALQKFGGTTLGNLGGVASLQESQSTVNAQEDPLALLKAFGGLLSRDNAGDLDMQSMMAYFDQVANRGAGSRDALGNAYYGPGF